MAPGAPMRSEPARYSDAWLAASARWASCIPGWWRCCCTALRPASEKADHPQSTGSRCRAVPGVGWALWRPIEQEREAVRASRPGPALEIVGSAFEVDLQTSISRRVQALQTQFRDFPRFEGGRIPNAWIRSVPIKTIPGPKPGALYLPPTFSIEAVLTQRVCSVEESS